MSLKESPASILVDGVCVVLVKIIDALLKARVFETLVNRVREQLRVGVQRELVHGVDTAHVIHDEEQKRSPLCTRLITLQYYMKRGCDNGKRK